MPLPVGGHQQFRRDHVEPRTLAAADAGGVRVVAGPEFDGGLHQHAAAIEAGRAERIVVDPQPPPVRLALDRAHHRRRKARPVGGRCRRQRRRRRHDRHDHRCDLDWLHDRDLWRRAPRRYDGRDRRGDGGCDGRRDARPASWRPLLAAQRVEADRCGAGRSGRFECGDAADARRCGPVAAELRHVRAGVVRAVAGIANAAQWTILADEAVAFAAQHVGGECLTGRIAGKHAQEQQADRQTASGAFLPPPVRLRTLLLPT